MKAKVYYGEYEGPDGRWLLVNRRMQWLNLNVPIRGTDDRQLPTTVYKLFREAWCPNKARKRIEGAGKITLPGTVVRRAGVRLPRRFYETIYPFLSGKQDVVGMTGRFLGFYWRFDLQHNLRFLGAVNRMLCEVDARIVLRWLELIAELPVEEREVVCVLLAETGADRINPAGEIFERVKTDLAWLRMIGGEQDDWLHWVFLYFSGLQAECSPAYLMSGLSLARDANQPAVLPSFAPCARFTHEHGYALRVLARHMRGDNRKLAFFIAGEFWEACAKNPWLVAVLEREDLFALSAERTRSMILYYIDRATSFATNGERPAAFRAFVRSEHDRLRSGFASVAPGYTDKYREFINDIDRLLEDRSITVAKAGVRRTLDDLARRMSCPPFSEDDSPPVQLLWKLAGPGSDISDTSLRKFERVMRSDTARELTLPGIESLLQYQQDFGRAAFRAFPRKFFSTGRLLGSLKEYARAVVLRKAREHALFKVPFEQKSIRTAVRWVRRILRREPGLTSPIHKKLHAFVFDDMDLSPLRKEFYERNFRRDLEFTRLELLERMARESLAESYPVRGATPDLHSLQVYSLLKTNRKPLRKYLKSADAGAGEHYLREHPSSRDWLERHAGFDQSLWLEGLRSIRRTETGTTLNIAPERRPDEVLKMGTYVSSCLSLGGYYMYNTVSVLVDVNKQVVFARDEQGKFIARQLLAVSEEDRLVCFDVYPTGIDASILRAFSEYDRTFARALGLPVHADSGDEYTIPCILSENFYDDYFWNLETSDVS